MNASNTDRAKLISEITQLIIESVNLKHVDLASVSSDTPLVETGIALDSIDILEIVVAVENRFGITFTDAVDGKQIFRTIGTIADFVQSHGA